MGTGMGGESLLYDGSRVQVVKPTWLRERVAEEHRRAAEVYEWANRRVGESRMSEGNAGCVCLKVSQSRPNCRTMWRRVLILMSLLPQSGTGAIRPV